MILYKITNRLHFEKCIKDYKYYKEAGRIHLSLADQVKTIANDKFKGIEGLGLIRLNIDSSHILWVNSNKYQDLFARVDQINDYEIEWIKDLIWENNSFIFPPDLMYHKIKKY